MEDCSLLSVHRSLLARFSVVQYSAEWTYHMLRFPVVWQYKQCCNENLYLCCLAHVPAYLQDVFLEVEWLGQVVCAFETVGDVGKLFSMEVIYTKSQQCITLRALANCVFKTS